MKILPATYYVLYLPDNLHQVYFLSIWLGSNIRIKVSITASRETMWKFGRLLVVIMLVISYSTYLTFGQSNDDEVDKGEGDLNCHLTSQSFYSYIVRIWNKAAKNTSAHGSILSYKAIVTICSPFIYTKNRVVYPRRIELFEVYAQKHRAYVEKICRQTMRTRLNYTMLCVYFPHDPLIKLGHDYMSRRSLLWTGGAPLVCNGTAIGHTAAAKDRTHYLVFQQDFYVINTYVRVWSWLVRDRQEYGQDWLENNLLEKSMDLRGATPRVGGTKPPIPAEYLRVNIHSSGGYLKDRKPAPYNERVEFWTDNKDSGTGDRNCHLTSQSFYGYLVRVWNKRVGNTTSHGSILSRRAILTSCAPFLGLDWSDQKTRFRSKADFLVIAQKRRDIANPWWNHDGSYICTQERNIQEIRPHPKCRPGEGGEDKDLHYNFAVLVIEKPFIAFSQHSYPTIFMPNTLDALVYYIRSLMNYTMLCAYFPHETTIKYGTLWMDIRHLMWTSGAPLVCNGTAIGQTASARNRHQMHGFIQDFYVIATYIRPFNWITSEKKLWGTENLPDNYVEKDMRDRGSRPRNNEPKPVINERSWSDEENNADLMNQSTMNRQLITPFSSILAAMVIYMKGLS
ncbi:hypothetical protein GE061_012467 [Apolygus lucorum]|uniref:Uncharacterized protein n=1 Tax=Apolygus lucorum TaxID=248454 RepID=A0A8S9XSF4_APOLU|nr:hypothetical protein GE061_012467 [Apolygus lucorum]